MWSRRIWKFRRTCLTKQRHLPPRLRDALRRRCGPPFRRRRRRRYLSNRRLPHPACSQIFTAEQLREYNRTLEDSLDRVRKVLGTVASKNLNSEQAQMVQRIQTFQKQAEQAREQDLVTAVNLARRADLLAQDLIKRLP